MSKQLVMITAGIVIGHTDALMLLVEYRKFPVPFTYTVGGAPLMPIFAAFVLITQGTAEDRTGIKKYIKFANLRSIQTVMPIVYPAYNATFVSLEGRSQMSFVLLLPVVKHLIKHISTQADSEYDDLATAFSASVGFFDALYMTKCMESAGTLIVGAAVIMVDMAQNYMAIWGLARQTRTLKTVKKYAEIRENRTSSQIPPDVLRWVADILIKTDNCDWLALRPRKSYIVSAQTRQTLDRMQSMHAHASPQTITSNRTAAPIENEPIRKSRVLTGKEILESASKEAVTETARLLHESEAVVVIEYIEAVVPIVYAIYIAILSHLANAKYYEDMKRMTEAKLHSVAANILVYALMRLLSLLYVHYMLKRHFGFSVFYQLAFVLESEWPSYQCEFVTWIVVVFQFLLAHSACFDDFYSSLARVHSALRLICVGYHCSRDHKSLSSPRKKLIRSPLTRSSPLAIVTTASFRLIPPHATPATTDPMHKKSFGVHAPARRKVYSANRLLAFDEYYKRASLTRVFLVLLLFCTPIAILILLFDFVPLESGRGTGRRPEDRDINASKNIFMKDVSHLLR